MHSSDGLFLDKFKKKIKDFLPKKDQYGVSCLPVLTETDFVAERFIAQFAGKWTFAVV